MKLMICDRCGKQLPLKKGVSAGSITLVWRDMLTGAEAAELQTGADLDFCPDCMEKIEAFIGGGSAVKPSAPEKPKVQGKKKGIDKGKVGALYDAGWSMSKIADEMKCSGQRISQIIKEIRGGDKDDDKGGQDQPPMPDAAGRD